MADTTPIPAGDLPKVTPGTLDSVVGVDESTGEARRFGLSELPASTAQAAQLQTYVDAAEAARDAAQLSAGIYANTTAGLAATTSGQYFSVPSADSAEYLILYKNNAGSALEVKRYPSAAAVNALKLIGVTGRVELVNPSASEYVGGLNSAGAWDASSAYGSIFIPVEAGLAYALRNTVQLYGGQYRAAFYTDLRENGGTSISVIPATTATNAAGQIYIAATAPANAKYIVVNRKFNAETISWSVIQADAYATPPAYQAVRTKINDVPIMDSQLTRTFAAAWAATEGYENLYSTANDLRGYYINSAGNFAADNAWRVGVIPVLEGQTYALYAPSGWTSMFQTYGTGPLPANDYPGSATLVATPDADVKTFTVPTGVGITHFFFNAKQGAGADLTSTAIVQLGREVPVRPLPYAASHARINGLPVKDRLARAKIDALPANPYAGKKIIHFGDSITEGTEGGYIWHVAAALKHVPINKGSSGARTGRLVAIATDQPDRQASLTFPTIDYTGVAAVTIMIGTNDAGGGTPTGSAADIPAKRISDMPFVAGAVTVDTMTKYWALFANTFWGNLALVVEYIKWKNPETVIYLMTPPAHATADYVPERAAIKGISELYSTEYIDTGKESGITRRFLTTYSYDGTHLNALGNKVFGRFVARKIAG